MHYTHTIITQTCTSMTPFWCCQDTFSMFLFPFLAFSLFFFFCILLWFFTWKWMTLLLHFIIRQPKPNVQVKQTTIQASIKLSVCLSEYISTITSFTTTVTNLTGANNYVTTYGTKKRKKKEKMKEKQKIYSLLMMQ